MQLRARLLVSVGFQQRSARERDFDSDRRSARACPAVLKKLEFSTALVRLLELLRRGSYYVLSLSETYYVECSGSAATVRYDEARHQPSAVTIGLYVPRPPR